MNESEHDTRQVGQGSPAKQAEASLVSISSESESQRERQSRESPALPADAQNRIGQRLKAMYDSVVQQPVPDRFAQLLDQLDGKGKGGDETGR